MDLCGPMHTQSLSGTKYFLILIDQFTGYTTTKFLKKKEETFASFKEYKAWSENFHQRKIMKIVSDGGGEFVNNCFKEYARIEGFEHSISLPYTPEHDGIAERATSTTTFLLNVAARCDKLSWYEKWFNQEPPVLNLKTFGCKAWDFEAARQVSEISRHVNFDETYFPNLLPPLNPTKLHNPISPISPNPLNPQTESIRNVTDKNDSGSEWEDELHDAMEEIPQRRIRVIGPSHPTLITGDISEENILPYQRRAHQTVESKTIPNHYQQAIKSKDSKKWEEAILKELDNMKNLKVWTMRDRMPEEHPITCTWVFKIKEDNKK
ncbi:hypothetical protein O181_069291 [Austropuccinia psidii MF-1]|uniref:Integrase catalytic domain-containing protein n=1 Tax=Austropuccinia psidii MF-1 TaxID=1389203 RepID=A0A9Q3EWI7_9BASI|nr:hypothetical protein [Austropuccinia psidii MF-1]